VRNSSTWSGRNRAAESIRSIPRSPMLATVRATTFVTAYALKRPDGSGRCSWSIATRRMLTACASRFHGAADSTGSFAGPVEIATFGSAQYKWNPASALSGAHEETAGARPSPTERQRRSHGPSRGQKKTSLRHAVRSASGISRGDSRKVGSR